MRRRSFLFDSLLIGTTVLLSKSDGQAQPATKTSFAQIRVARSTTNLEEIIRFYENGLQLPIIGHFENHSGYSGVMFGTPTSAFHLEFTCSATVSPVKPVGNDDLLVLYHLDESVYQNTVRRLREMKYQEATLDNPYWRHESTVFLDPDGWHVVLHHGAAFSSMSSTPG